MKQYFSFQWHITDECDQRCRHCYIYAGDVCKKPESMNWTQMEDTFYNCLDFCEVYGRQPYFYLTGGDPILHPDFWRLLALCSFPLMVSPQPMTGFASPGRLPARWKRSAASIVPVCAASL